VSAPTTEVSPLRIILIACRAVEQAGDGGARATDEALGARLRRSEHPRDGAAIVLAMILAAAGTYLGLFAGLIRLH
jgi:hypothetical protein